MYIKKGNMTYFGRQLDFMAVDLHEVLGYFLNVSTGFSPAPVIIYYQVLLTW